jgi:hypothetical protein
VACFYSRTTRRYRGSSKEKAQRLQERLWQAERLLKTAGLVNHDQRPIHMSGPGGTPASYPDLHDDHSSMRPVRHQGASVDLSTLLSEAQANPDVFTPALPPNNDTVSPLQHDPSAPELTAREKLVALEPDEAATVPSDQGGGFGGSQRSVMDPCLRSSPYTDVR